MKKFFKVLIPIILTLAIILGLGWYLFIYDKEFTRDMLLQGARYFESQGEHGISSWFYDQAYEQADDNDAVAIELAQQHKAAGNYTKAEYTLSKAIADGGGVDLYVALCKLYVEQDKLLDASKLLDAVLSENSAVDESVKQTLSSMRPDAPTTTATPGFYTQYITVPVSVNKGTLYVNANGEFPSVHDPVYSEPVALVDGENTLYAISVGDNGMVSSLSIFGYTIGGVVKEVKFADKAVESALRTQLEVSDSTVIYTNDLWNLKFFTVPAEAKDLSDLQHLIFLEELALDSCVSGQLSQIASLSNLNFLSVSNMEVSNEELKIIGALPKLKSLTLDNCGLATTAGLEQANQLTYLNLNNNTIRNIDALMSMSDLQELHMEHNALTDLTAITNLKKLSVLNVPYNSIQSLVPVYNLTTLQKLNLSNNQVVDISNIDKLTGLTHLDLSFNQVVDASGIAACTEMAELNISNNQLTDITALSALVKMTSFNFSHNQVLAIPAFPAESVLVTIDGSHNLIDTLKPLSGLKELNNVLMDYNEAITQVEPLKDCPKLILVNVYGTKVADVTVLLDMSVVVNYNPTEGF